MIMRGKEEQGNEERRRKWRTDEYFAYALICLYVNLYFITHPIRWGSVLVLECNFKSGIRAKN